MRKKITQKPPTHLRLLQHLILNTSIGILLIAAALVIGILGYHLFERMSWTDSFLNASMILSGMGPATTLVTTGGKLFAGFYALFSGLAFIAIVVILLSPIIHEFFRKIHVESGKASKDDNS
jgi:hypothetical protein